MNAFLGRDFILWVQFIVFLDETYATDFFEEIVEFFMDMEDINNINLF